MSPNGDSSPILFRVHAGGIIDIGLNTVVFTSNITISESPDVVQGTIFDVEIDYNTGTLILYSTEYLDNTPSTNLDLSKIIMVDGNAGIDGVMSDLNLVGATVTSGNDLTVTVVLTEAQRVRCMKASGTRGGDGENILLSVTAGAINDLSANPVLSSSNVLIKETVDSTVPVIDDVILDLDSGILSLLFSETIDVSPASRVNVTDIALIDSESGSDQILLYLRDSTLITSVDALRVNISLNAFERVAAVAKCVIFRWNAAEIASKLHST
jgi:hypothetical protein